MPPLPSLLKDNGGWDEGFSAQLTAHKSKGYGVVILTNSNHPRFINELVRSVALSYDWDNLKGIRMAFGTEKEMIYSLQSEDTQSADVTSF